MNEEPSIYLYVDNERTGPFTEHDVIEQQDKGLPADAQIWTPESNEWKLLTDWKAAAQLPPPEAEPPPVAAQPPVTTTKTPEPTTKETPAKKEPEQKADEYREEDSFGELEEEEDEPEARPARPPKRRIPVGPLAGAVAGAVLLGGLYFYHGKIQALFGHRATAVHKAFQWNPTQTGVSQHSTISSAELQQRIAWKEWTHQVSQTILAIAHSNTHSNQLTEIDALRHLARKGQTEFAKDPSKEYAVQCARQIALVLTDTNNPPAVHLAKLQTIVTQLHQSLGKPESSQTHPKPHRTAHRK